MKINDGGNQDFDFSSCGGTTTTKKQFTFLGLRKETRTEPDYRPVYIWHFKLESKSLGAEVKRRVHQRG